MENEEVLDFYILYDQKKQKHKTHPNGDFRIYLKEHAEALALSENEYRIEHYATMNTNPHIFDANKTFIEELGYQYYLAYDYRRKEFRTLVIDNDCSKVCKFLNKMLKEKNE